MIDKYVIFRTGSYITTGLITICLETCEIVLPYLIILILCYLLDIFTSIALQRRIEKKGIKTKSGGKYSSKYASRIWGALLRQFSFVLIIALAQKVLFPDIEFQVARIVMAIMICGQFLSILENESTCNDSKWALIVSKVLKSKMEKHLNIDLNDDGYIDGKKINDSNTQENEND